jgi:flagellar hook protein FlgE
MAMDALFSGVSGLQVNQQMLDVIGNNLANSNTTGYKAQSVNFADLVYQNLSDGTAANGTTVGGTNPIQVGSGAKVASISTNLLQGTLQETGNQLDLALQGNGYFVALNGPTPQYTRAGTFGVDSQNMLVDPSTGYLIQRFGPIGEGSATSPAFQAAGNNNIKIPIGAGVPGNATTSVVLQGNLSASALGPMAQTLTSVQPFTSANAPATLATPLSSLGDNVNPYGAGDTITLQGIDASGNPVNATISVAPTAAGPFTMGDLVNAINTNFVGSTASLDASGNLVVTANQTGPTGLSLSITDGASNTGGSNWGNHNPAVTTNGKDGDTVNTSIQVYDPQGNAHTLNLVFQKQTNNNWTLTGAVNPSDGTMVDNLVSNINFNQNGSLGQVTGAGSGNATMSIQFNGFTAPQTLSFNFGTTNGFNGVTQNGGTSSAAATGQDGFAAGFLSKLSISQDGIVNGIFTNGQTLAIAQLAVANFANPSALNRIGNNYFTLGSESGPPMVGTGLTGGRGSVQQGELESSNVDVSLEFTRLIIAQQGYQVNAHVISTANQILQDLGNILR